jgi:hypothetical protein
MTNKDLSERNAHLILEGGRITGTYEEGYYYNEESMYIDEADTILEFCKWIDSEVGGCGRANIKELWYAFNNNDAVSAIIVSKWKEKFAELRSHTRN